MTASTIGAVIFLFLFIIESKFVQMSEKKL